MERILNTKFYVTQCGKIWSEKTKRIVKTYKRHSVDGSDYLYAQLIIDKKQTKIRIDYLVFETYVSKIKHDEILLRKNKNYLINCKDNFYIMKIEDYLQSFNKCQWKKKTILNNEYYISEYGDVYSVKNNIILHQFLDKNGYYYISFRSGKEEKKIKIHRIVAETYIENPENKPQVNHKNGIKTKNHKSNLEWATASENTQHSFDIGLQIPKYKTVYQYDLNNNFIAKYKSLKEAAKITNTNINGIIAVCKKNKRYTANNYVWKYELCND